MWDGGGVENETGSLSNRVRAKAKLRDLPPAQGQRRNAPLQRIKGECGVGAGPQGLSDQEQPSSSTPCSEPMPLYLISSHVTSFPDFILRVDTPAAL